MPTTMRQKPSKTAEILPSKAIVPKTTRKGSTNKYPIVAVRTSQLSVHNHEAESGPALASFVPYRCPNACATSDRRRVTCPESVSNALRLLSDWACFILPSG